MTSYGKVPAYVDISHSRAPYKNAMIAGVGGSPMNGYGSYGYGTDPTPPPPPTNGNGGVTEATYVQTDDKGYRTVNPGFRPMMEALLAAYQATVIGGQYNNVKIRPFTAEETNIAKSDPAAAAMLKSRSALTWVKAQVDAGQVVFMGMPAFIALMTATPPQEGADTMGTFPSGSPEAREAAKSPMGVVIEGDIDGSMFANVSPWVWAVVGVVAVGGVALAVKKSRKGSSRGRGSSLPEMSM